MRTIQDFLTMVGTGTLTNEQLTNVYRDAFTRLYGSEPEVAYLGHHWYRINGEAVDASTLLREIDRLREMDVLQRKSQRKRLVSRLIDKLRGL